MQQFRNAAVLDNPGPEIERFRRAEQNALPRAGGEQTAADAAGGTDVLGDQQSPRPAQRFEDRARVERIDEIELHDLRRNAETRKDVRRGERFVDHRPVGDESEVPAPAQNRRGAPAATELVVALAAARIADGDGAVDAVAGELEHFLQLCKARGTQHRHVRHAAEIVDVEDALVRLPVPADTTGAVNGKNDVLP